MKAPKVSPRKLEQMYRYAVLASHAILENMDVLIEVKAELKKDDFERDELKLTELWNDLDEHTQNLLMTAYSKGGAFPAKEREIINKIQRGW